VRTGRGRSQRWRRQHGLPFGAAQLRLHRILRHTAASPAARRCPRPGWWHARDEGASAHECAAVVRTTVGMGLRPLMSGLRRRGTGCWCPAVVPVARSKSTMF
jgi:hypothetical protein